MHGPGATAHVLRGCRVAVVPVAAQSPPDHGAAVVEQAGIDVAKPGRMAPTFCTEELSEQLQRLDDELRRLEDKLASGQASPLDEMMLEATRRTRATTAQGLRAHTFRSMGRTLHVYVMERDPCVSYAGTAVMRAVEPDAEARSA
jgi:hypothetical protein